MLIAAAAFASMLVSAAGAQQAQPPALRAALEAKFSELHKAGAFPGGTAGIALADGTTIAIAVGVSDREAKTLMQPTDRLLMGSIGKTYVSARS
jgi:CubicO group peptidase (beta-lactamase class C family)